MDIDREIAEKIMGWERVFVGTQDHGYWYYQENKEYPNPPEGVCHVDDWHPSTNIAQAFEVVEKMRKKGQPFKLHDFFNGDQKVYKCAFGIHLAINERTSTAICLAALKAAEAEVK